MNINDDVFQGVAESEENYSQSNKEMNLAWQFVANTGVSVFLTGVAGTGKTTFLRKLRELTPKRMVVLAPTGVAAINAGGQTIHSFFQLPFGPFLGDSAQSRKAAFKMSQKKKDMIRTVDLLVIDEISMVRADLLDQVDDALRRYRDPVKPFGGVQLLMIGDLMQLAPVSKDEEWRLLQHKYDTPYFFSSHALKRGQYVTIELKHIYRQQDIAFIDLLNHVRHGDMTPDVVRALNTRFIPNFSTWDSGYIRLTTHNATANTYNEQQLAALPGENLKFEAAVKGDFPENNYPNDFVLTVKPGAQVMFVKNDSSGAHQYYNGKIGTVEKYDAENKAILVRCKGEENLIAVVQDVWENVKYSIDPDTKEIKEDVAGTFTQYPLRLAWAITVHKSQGLTFDHAVLDINRSFTHGQVYVALSRCRSLEGLVLSSPIMPASVITDQSVNTYIEQQQAASESNAANLPAYCSEYAIEMLDELYSMTNIRLGLSRLIRVLDEYLYQVQGRLLEHLRALAPEVEEKLIGVGYKFGPAYRQAMALSNGQVEGTPIEQRIKDSAQYFTTELEHLLYVGLKGTAINIENKAVAEQYKNALLYLRGEIAAKLYVFDKLATEPFSVQKYLRFKAQALLAEPQRGDISQPRVKRSATLGDSDTTPKTQPQRGDISQPRVERSETLGNERANVSTAQITYQLYQEGLTPAEIAAKRGLKPDTIAKHLATLVAQGLIDINRLISPARQQRIREVAATFDTTYTLTDIKVKLPEDYKFYEIRLVLNYDQNKQ